MAKKEEGPLTAKKAQQMFDAVDEAHPDLVGESFLREGEAAKLLAEVGKDLKILPMPHSMFYIPSTQIEALEKKMAEVIKKFNVLVDLITEEAK
jgi:hypothetical protein